MAIDDLRIEPIDRLTSHVLAGGGAFFRIIHSTPGDPAGSEFVAYDQMGVSLYRRIGALSDPHSFAWDGSHLVVPNTHYNQLVWITPEGSISKTWHGGCAVRDTWHINGVTVRNGRVIASAFGRFESEDALKAGPHVDRGIVFDPETGRDLITGLSCPHDPRFVDGAWLICDSRKGTLVRVDEYSGERLHTLEFGRWTRGVAVVKDRVYVGLSAERYDPDDTMGAIAIIDRRTWQVIKIVPLPCKEVNSVSVVPRALFGAIRRGYRTNAYRVHVQDNDEMFRLVGSIHPSGKTTQMRPLDAGDCRVTVTAVLSERVLPGEAFDALVEVTNHGRRTLLSAPPHPVNVGFEVLRQDGTVVGGLDDRRAALSDPISPGQTLAVTVRIIAPEEPGTYTILFTLVQESICWFHSIAPENAASARLEVRAHEHETTSESDGRRQPFVLLQLGSDRPRVLE